MNVSQLPFNFSPLSLFWSIIVIYFIFYLSTYAIYFYRLTQLPQYKPYTTVYSVFYILARGKPGAFRQIFKDHEYYFQEHGYHIVWFLSFPFLFIGRYDRAQEIVGEPATLDKGMPFVAAETFFGQGIISSKDEKWKSRRRMVRQQFSPLSIPHYVDNIHSLAVSIRGAIEKSIENERATGELLDIRGFFSIPTMKMVVGKAAGVDLSDRDYAFLIEAMEKFLHEIDRRVVFPPFYSDSIYEIYLKLTGVRGMINKTNEILTSAIRRKYDEIKEDLITKPRSVLKADAAGYDNHHKIQTEENNNLIEPNEGSEDRRSNSLAEAFIRAWVKPETGLTSEIEEAILEEMKSVIVAGSDGPDSLMTWFTYILGCYPEYQEKIYEEVKDSDIKDWTMAKVNSFPFLDQCFKEATRLYTSVPVKIRKSEHDQMVDGKIIPKGTLIIVSLVSILKDPKIFPQPFDFKPQRFAPDAEPKIPNGAYIPFGLRPRDCIGQRLAPFYIKFIVGSIIKSYKIKSHRHWNDIDYKLIFVLKPTDPMLITFTQR